MTTWPLTLLEPWYQRGLAYLKAIYSRTGVLEHELKELHRLVDRLQALVPGPAVSGTATLSLEPIMADGDFVLPDDRTATIKLNLKDAIGVLGAKLDAAPTYEVSDPSIAVAADANDFSVGHVSFNGTPTSNEVKIVAHCVGPAGPFDVPVQPLIVGAGPAVSGDSTITLDPLPSA